MMNADDPIRALKYRVGPGGVGVPIYSELEAIAELDSTPEYILFFVPSAMYSRFWHRLIRCGWWELLSVDDYLAGKAANGDWTVDAPGNTSSSKLTEWVGDRLGYPVHLKADTHKVKANRRYARWHIAPVYWVRRNN